MNDLGLFRDCQRFQPRERREELNEDSAMVYVNLRKAGLSKEKSLEFCKSVHCKMDATQKQHGPPGYKIFKTKLEKFKLVQGWQLVGKLKYHDIEDLKQRNEIGLIKDNTEKETAKLQKLKEYYDELESKYNFTELHGDALVREVRALSNDSDSKIPKYQIKTKNMVYYELADYVEQSEIPIKKSLVIELEAFEDIIPRAMKQKFKIEPKSVEKSVSRQSDYYRRSKVLQELSSTYRGRMTIQEPNEEARILARRTFKQDFNDSNYVSKIYEFPSSSALSSLRDLEETSALRKRQSALSINDRRKSRRLLESPNSRFRCKLDEFCQKAVEFRKT